MITIQYSKVNPGGNITAIVHSKILIAERVAVAKKILNIDSDIEQVGFWCAPHNLQAKARLEMMGGEFCGNATRCLGYTVYKEQSLSAGEYLVESSGMEELIPIHITDKSVAIVVDMQQFKILEQTDQKTIIKLPGITHCIVNEHFDKNQAKTFLAQNQLLTEPAAGVITVTTQADAIKITPLVWVRDTETLYAETACASGTLATAYYIAQNNPTQSTFNIIQPSNSVFTVTIHHNLMSLSGPILGYSVHHLEL